jgi:hypothetical protein
VADENADWAQPGGSANKASGNLALAKAPRHLWTAEVAGIEPRRVWPRRRLWGRASVHLRHQRHAACL